MECPIGLDKNHCENCYLSRGGKCDYERVIESRAHSEKRYCSICRQKTTFVYQPSGCFCSKCGYKEEKEK